MSDSEAQQAWWDSMSDAQREAYKQRTQRRWNVSRTRPGDGAPSMSLGFRAGSTNVALIRYLERYPQQQIGTRIDIRPFGTDDISATYIRTQHVWEQQS